MAFSPAYYARELRHKLKITGPVNLLEVLEFLGLTCYEESFKNIEGCLLKVDNNWRVLINGNIRYQSRKSFTIAHEIGHFYIPHHPDRIFRCNVGDIQRYQGNDVLENEANEFASELLLPADEVRKFVTRAPGIAVFKNIADIYGASLTATAIKVVELSHERMAIVLSEQGIIKWFRKTRNFPYWINTGQLHEWTYAYDFFSNRQLPGGQEKVLASAWCRGAGNDDILLEEFEAFESLEIVDRWL